MSIFFAINRLIDRVLSPVGAHWPVLQLGGEANGTLGQASFYIAVGSLMVGLVAVVLQNYCLLREIRRRQQAEAELRVSEQRFRRAIAMAPLPIMLHADDGEVLHINGTWTELTGYTQQDIPTTQAWAQRAYRDRADIILKTIIAKKYSSETRHDEGDAVITTRTGQQRIWACSSSVLEKLPDGRRVAISMAVDVTEHRQAEKALRESEERYRSIYNQAAVGLVNGTIDLQFIDVNPRFCEMLGYSREDLLTKSVMDITHPEDRLQSKSVIQRLFLNETPYVLQKKRYLHKDGSFFWCSTGISVVRDAQGNPKHTLAVIHDISQQVKAEEQLKHDALHDELTGLPNRSLLMERLDLALKRTQRYPETQLAILFIDLDNFKVVNDSLGHLAGDELLIAIANQLKLILRETDLAARLGGDEFVILLEEITNLSEVILVAERILEVLQSPLNIDDRELFPSASIGIVTSSTTTYHQAAELLRDADVAMYCAKQSGRSQYAIFSPTMHLQALQRLRLEHDLRKALDNHEFLI